MILNRKAAGLVYLVFSFITVQLSAQSKLDINGDGALNILILGTSQSIQDNFEEFNSSSVTQELQNILSNDTSIGLPTQVIAEDMYRSKTVATGIAGQFTANRTYYLHTLMQYYYWPDGHDDRMDQLAGNLQTDWDYVVIQPDPFMVAQMPGYFALGLNKVVSQIQKGGAVPLLMMEWLDDTTFTTHFEEFTYRAADGVKSPIQVIPAGLAWNQLPSSLKDVAIAHPSPNGAYLAASSIYAHLTQRSASSTGYNYNPTIANIAFNTVTNAVGQTHYNGSVNFVSPFQGCGISDTNLIYNQGGTSTEYGILTGLQWVTNKNNKTLQFSSNPPIHFNYGRSSMGSTHLYVVDSTQFDYSFGYPLQDDASTGHVTMLYGIDKRSQSSDVETDLGTARQMINQAQLPNARLVPIRTLIAQMLEEIPGVRIYPQGDPWHLSQDVNKAIGAYMYTLLTQDCTCDPEPIDSAEWRTWMAHKIGQRTAWTVMSMNEISPCSDISVQSISSCGSFTWIDGVTYTQADSSATVILTNTAGCDSVVRLNLTLSEMDLGVVQIGTTLQIQQAGATYQWIDCNTSLPIPGANGQVYTPGSNGNYAAIVTFNGCVDTSDCFAFQLGNVSTEEFTLASQMRVFPNPTQGAFTVHLGREISSGKVFLLDLSGRVLQTQKILHQEQFQMAIQQPAGLYLIKIESDNQVAIVRLIVE